MTIERKTTRPSDLTQLAAAARSILSCPDDVQLVVEGVSDICEGLDSAAPGARPGLGMQDINGHPVFSCPPTSALANAAREGRSALLTLTSGLGRAGSPDRDATLTLAGTLDTTAAQECDCCAQLRAQVTMRLDFAILARTGDEPDQRVRVPLGAFCAAEHHLNRGFLQRSVEHANECHQEELRRAVSATTGTRLHDVGGVLLTDLRPDRVEVQWIDIVGAHRRLLAFDRAATTPSELGDLLREQLHAGLC